MVAVDQKLEEQKMNPEQSDGEDSVVETDVGLVDDETMETPADTHGYQKISGMPTVRSAGTDADTAA